MIKKKSNTKFMIGMAVAFLLPLSFYFIARLLSKDKIHMPKFYGVERVEDRVKEGKTISDTIYHKVGNISLTNQLGDLISTDNTLKGKILIVNFFFVDCPTICPRLTGNVSILQKAFRRNPKMERSLDADVQFLSITVNPAHDTFQLLRNYADRFKANHDSWWFLTGDKAAIYNFARNELKLSVGPGDGGADDFVHTEQLTLIDRNRNIRGYYDGLDTAQLKKCADDIVLLTMEKEHKRN
jgi:protein SCO1/2